MDRELLTPLIFGGIFMAIFIGVAYITSLMLKKSELVCRELIENHSKELKMLADCTLSSGFWPDKGIIALFDDRLVFTSLMFNKSREIALAQVMGVSPAKSGGSKGARALELNLGSEKLKLSVDQFVFPAWKLMLEKKASLNSSAGFPAIG